MGATWEPPPTDLCAPADSQERVWVLLYDDPDRMNELWHGDGAEDAARRRWAEASQSWNCTLLETCRRQTEAQRQWSERAALTTMNLQSEVDALRARVGELEAELFAAAMSIKGLIEAIERAPHGDQCSHNFDARCCDCWKRDALGTEEAELRAERNRLTAAHREVVDSLALCIAERDRYREAIERAPHERDCSYAEGYSNCTCWKRDALGNGLTE